MPKLTLTPQQKSVLESRHAILRDARECDRIKAVLLRSEGWSVTAIPHKADAEKQAEFVEHYKTLKATLPKDEVVLFMDAVHPTQATKITPGWIRKGVDKLISTTGSRTRMNIVGAIELNNLSAAVFDQFKTVNGQAIIDFFKKVRSAYASKSVIHMVLDGAGYHRSHVCKRDGGRGQKAGHKVGSLPASIFASYSPNLNPIERLWKVNKERRVRSK